MRLRFWHAAVALVVMAGCGGELHLEKLEADPLFERGAKELAARHWDDAIAAFDRLTIQYPSFARLQEARFDLGQAYFGKKEYVTSAGEFDRLANDYPLGPWADDSRYMVCRSYEELSPVVQLDQEYTQSAIDHCNSLESYYPNSPFVAKAKEVVQRLTDKLATKGLLAGEYYFLRRHAYDSSLIYFEDVLKSYPTSNAAPQALLRMIQVYDKLGYKEEAQAARERLLKDYPGSSAAKVVAVTPAAHS